MRITMSHESLLVSSKTLVILIILGTIISLLVLYYQEILTNNILKYIVLNSLVLTSRTSRYSIIFRRTQRESVNLFRLYDQ